MSVHPKPLPDEDQVEVVECEIAEKYSNWILVSSAANAGGSVEVLESRTKGTVPVRSLAVPIGNCTAQWKERKAALRKAGSFRSVADDNEAVMTRLESAR
jgi:hypothetical protein